MSSGHIVQIIGAVIDVEFHVTPYPTYMTHCCLKVAIQLWKSSSSWVTALFVPSPWAAPKA